MRVAIIGAGFLAVITLCAISMAMNFRFGYQLGANPIDGYVYGFASVCADIMKALLPFLVAWAWAHRQYWIVGAGVILIGLFTAYSITSSLGFSALNRAGTEAARGAPALQLEAARRDLKDTVAKIDALSPARPISAIENQIAELKNDERWRSTAGCTDATARLSIAFCEGHKRLLSELSVAKRHATLEARRQAHQGRVDALLASGVVMDSDPQAKLLSKIVGVDREHIKTGLTILIAALVELGSVLGFFVLSAGAATRGQAADHSAQAIRPVATPLTPEAPQIEAQPDAVPVPATVAEPERLVDASSPGSARDDEAKTLDDWFTQRLSFVDGASETATSLYEDFQKWAITHGVKDMTFTEFGTWLNHQGLSKSKIAGRIRFIGVSLRPDDDDKVVVFQKGA